MRRKPVLYAAMALAIAALLVLVTLDLRDRGRALRLGVHESQGAR